MLIPCSRAQVVVCGPWNPAGPPDPGPHGLGRTRGDLCPPGGRTLRPRKFPPVSRKPASSWKFPCPAREELVRSLEEFAAQQATPAVPALGPRNCWRRPSWRPVTCRGRTCSSLPKSRTWRSKSGGRPWNWRSPAVFKARRVPCRETDLVIHLTRAAMARLVAAGAQPGPGRFARGPAPLPVLPVGSKPSGLKVRKGEGSSRFRSGRDFCTGSATICIVTILC